MAIRDFENNIFENKVRIWLRRCHCHSAFFETLSSKFPTVFKILINIIQKYIAIQYTAQNLLIIIYIEIYQFNQLQVANYLRYTM